MSFISQLPKSFTLNERFFSCKFLSWVQKSKKKLSVEGEIVLEIGCSPATYRKIRGKLVDLGLVERTKRANGQVVYECRAGHTNQNTLMSEYRHHVNDVILRTTGEENALLELSHSTRAVLLHLVSFSDDIGMLPMWDSTKYSYVLGIGEASFFSHMRRIKEAKLLLSGFSNKGWAILNQAIASRELALGRVVPYSYGSDRQLIMINFEYPRKLFAAIRNLQVIFKRIFEAEKVLWGPEQLLRTGVDEGFLSLDAVDWQVVLGQLSDRYLTRNLDRDRATELLGYFEWLIYCYPGSQSNRYEAYFCRCYGRLAAVLLKAKQTENFNIPMQLAAACSIFQLTVPDSIKEAGERYIDGVSFSNDHQSNVVDVDLSLIPDVSKAIAFMLIDLVLRDAASSGLQSRTLYSGFKAIDYNGTFVANAQIKK